MHPSQKDMHLGIECYKCGQRIFSEHKYDFKFCACKTCFVDGGRDYLVYGAEESSRIRVVYKTGGYVRDSNTDDK